jgi:hypothetical protein
MKRSVSARKFILWLVLIPAALFSSCAASYNPIRPQNLVYNYNFNENGLNYSFRYDVLRERGNNKLGRKEDNKNIRLVAVKITNNRGKAINVGNDLEFFAGQDQILPFDPAATKHFLKQSTGSYLLYLLLTFLNLIIIDPSGGTTFIPIGVILGPSITVGNMLTASNANSKLYAELLSFDIMNAQIQDGETAFGLICFRSTSYKPISIKPRKTN